MAHVVDTTYGRNRDLGQITDPALLDYYRSLGYTIDGTVAALTPGAPTQTVLGLQVPYGATDGEVVTVKGGQFITAPATGGGGGGSLPAGSYVPEWQANTAYTAGQYVLNPSGQIVSANSNFTSGSSYNASNWTLVQAGNYVALPAAGDPTGSVPTKQSDGSVAYAAPVDTTARTAASAAQAQAGLSTPAGSTFGLDPAFSDGTITKPWKPASALSGNLVSGVTFPVSTTSTAVSQTVRLVRVDLFNAGSPARVTSPQAVRILFKVSIPATSANFGNPTLKASFKGTDGIATIGTDVSLAGLNQSDQLNYIGMAEIPAPATGIAQYLDLNMVFPNNYTGTTTLLDADIRLIGHASNLDTLRVGSTVANLDTRTTAPTGFLLIDRPAIMPDARPVRIRTALALDGTTELAYTGSAVFDENVSISGLNYKTTEPGLYGSAAYDNNNTAAAGYFKATGLHIGNNDLVLSVKKTDGSYELRCNTHGGEVGRTGQASQDYILEVDRGYGTWDRLHGDSQGLRCYRTRFTSKTAVTRSDQAGTPFANIDRIYTFFADGTVRCDRTITWLTTQTVNRAFILMNSLDPNTPLLGRIGRGQKVLKEMNGRRPSTRANATLSGATTAGATTANITATAQAVNPSYVGAVVTVGQGGTIETARVASATNASLTFVAALANAHSSGDPIYVMDDPTALTAAATAGATTIQTNETIGRGAYLTIGTGNRTERHRIASNTSGTAGAYIVTITEPLLYNHANGDTVQQTWPGYDNVADSRSEWCAYQEPQYLATFGQIFDRAAMQAHIPAANLYTNLVEQQDATFYGGKAYTVLEPTQPASITAGTVWTDTFYWLYTVPKAQETFHKDIADLATATPAQRAAIYPAT